MCTCAYVCLQLIQLINRLYLICVFFACMSLVCKFCCTFSRRSLMTIPNTVLNKSQKLYKQFTNYVWSTTHPLSLCRLRVTQTANNLRVGQTSTTCDFLRGVQPPVASMWRVQVRCSRNACKLDPIQIVTEILSVNTESWP